MLAVEDQALATSGDYHNFYGVDGVHRSPTIDPRTGRPSPTTSPRSASSSRAMLADGWATALNVLGPDAGLELAT
ncbi:FAD:protein FMN transferase, partial [Nannocystis sp.]|uniref:FAD:protein FMN transferase n=1 Tax=Nannocystis sp. TaxID=1962667 RepID=UPI0025CE4F42